jgi:hypothetical protein
VAGCRDGKFTKVKILGSKEQIEIMPFISM